MKFVLNFANALFLKPNPRYLMVVSGAILANKDAGVLNIAARTRNYNKCRLRKSWFI